MASVPTSGAAPPPPVWDTRPAASDHIAYGGFWIRFAAYLIDAVVLSIVGGIIGAIFGVIVGLSGGSVNSARFGGYGIGIVLGWLYFAFMESSERGATLGKMALGLRVVTDQGQRLSFANATGRYFAKFVSAIILGVGFIMIAFTDRKRALHDMIAGTLVIKTR
jgi:uncharacterized RDD family membrane protein YckC